MSFSPPYGRQGSSFCSVGQTVAERAMALKARGLYGEEKVIESHGRASTVSVSQLRGSALSEHYSRGQMMGQHAAMYQALLASRMRISGPGSSMQDAPVNAPAPAPAKPQQLPSHHQHPHHHPHHQKHQQQQQQQQQDPMQQSPPDSPSKEAIVEVILPASIKMAKFAPAVAAKANAANSATARSRPVVTYR